MAGNERTFGGVVGKAVGRAKEAVGSATANDALACEGRLQQAQRTRAMSDERLEARHEEADARREQARGRAATRRRQAARAAQNRTQLARQAENERLASSRRQEAQAEERIERADRKGR